VGAHRSAWTRTIRAPPRQRKLTKETFGRSVWQWEPREGELSSRTGSVITRSQGRLE
jgi:hypothetical protein